MSNAQSRTDRATLADYELFVAERPDDERWELIDGVIEMMTNPTANHGQIAANLAVPLKLFFDRRGCRTYMGSLRVQRDDARKSGDATIPDIVVHCGESRNRTFVTDPLIVVEVLSRSTMDRDRGPKLAFYKSIPSIGHIVLVYQDQMRVEHYRRAEDHWRLTVLRRPADRLVFEAVGFETTLETIYFDVRVLRPLETEEVDDDEP